MFPVGQESLMNDQGKVNAQITDALAVVKQATMSDDMVRINGAGKAYQSVAQSMAIAIQDATDNLRNVGQISNTAQGVAIAKLLETKNAAYGKILEYAQRMNDDAAETFKTIGINAADILKGFPSD
jgi:hypothetical protein